MDTLTQKIDGSVGVIRLKAFGYDPDGLHEFDQRTMPSPAEITAQAKRLGVEVGNVRPGVLDTGKPLLQDEQANLSTLVDNLETQGWVIVAAHKRREPKPNLRTQMRSVVEIILVKNGERRPLLTDDAIRVAKSFFAACWGSVTLWQNLVPRREGDVPNVTINLAGRMKEVRADVEELELVFTTPASSAA